MDNLEIKKLFVQHPRMSDDTIALKMKLPSGDYVRAIRESFTPEDRLGVLEILKFGNKRRAYAGGNGAVVVREE